MPFFCRTTGRERQGKKDFQNQKPKWCKREQTSFCQMTKVVPAPRGIDALRNAETSKIRAFRSKEIKRHAWDHRRSSNCPLVAGVFRISRNNSFHSYCPNCGHHSASHAFPETNHRKYIKHCPKIKSRRQPLSRCDNAPASFRSSTALRL